MLNAIFGSVDAWAIVRFNLGLIVPVKPLATLERWRGVGRVTMVTPDCNCYWRMLIDLKEGSYQSVFEWAATRLCNFLDGIEMKTLIKGLEMNVILNRKDTLSYANALEEEKTLDIDHLEGCLRAGLTRFQAISMETWFVYIYRDESLDCASFNLPVRKKARRIPADIMICFIVV